MTSAVGVCIGPGSYTGVRIGVSVAKGLASSWKLPLVGITTLDVLVAAQPGTIVRCTRSSRQDVAAWALRYRYREDGPEVCRRGVAT